MQTLLTYTLPLLHIVHDTFTRLRASQRPQDSDIDKANHRTHPSEPQSTPNSSCQHSCNTASYSTILKLPVVQKIPCSMVTSLVDSRGPERVKPFSFSFIFTSRSTMSDMPHSALNFIDISVPDRTQCPRTFDSSLSRRRQRNADQPAA